MIHPHSLTGTSSSWHLEDRLLWLLKSGQTGTSTCPVGNIRGCEGHPGDQGVFNISPGRDGFFRLTTKKWPTWYVYMESSSFRNVRGWEGGPRPGKQGYWRFIIKDLKARFSLCDTRISRMLHAHARKCLGKHIWNRWNARQFLLLSNSPNLKQLYWLCMNITKDPVCAWIDPFLLNNLSIWLLHTSEGSIKLLSNH